MKIIVTTVCTLLMFGIICAQDQYIPRLSPVPGKVEGIRNAKISLNGLWTIRTATIPASDIEVPGEWTMQGFDVPEGETAVYTRKFTIPDDWQHYRVKIRFDAVSSYGLVTVNGQAVGEHEGGMVPFELDITQALVPGENTLQVDVKANTVSDKLGCVSQYAVHTVGGLIRKVTLYALPDVNIASMNVTTLLDKTYKHATLQIATRIANETNVTGKKEVAYTLTDASGKKVASVRVKADAENTEARLAVSNARLWNPEHPYLYLLETTLLVDGKAVQTNQQRIGLRQVEVRGNSVFVNGKKIKLHGVNRHETHPLRGRSLTPELCREDAGIFRAGNCNYIRTSHYPPSEEFLDACDELGLFVESEAAITWIQHHASPIWKLWDYTDEKFLPYMVRANLDNIAANRHHPSVIIWSLGNESRWSGLWMQVLDAVKKADPSRPTSFHDQCWGAFNNAASKADIANYHYPGINGPAACDTMSRPVLFGEYAHLSCYNRTELATDPGVRALFGKPLVQMYDSMYHHSACLGGALWSGIDDIFHLADGRIVGYGPWGPVDGWRREKPEYTGMKKAYTPFRLLAYKKIINKKSKLNEIELSVENRYDFTNLSQVNIRYGNRNGKWLQAKADIEPRSAGKIILTVPDEWPSEIYLEVTDPRGFICAEELLYSREDITEKPLLSHPVLQETAEAYMIRNGTQDYIISKITGLITRAAVDGKALLLQGPVFCLVPMDSDDGGKPNVAGETYQNNIYPVKNYPFYTLFAESVHAETAPDGSISIISRLAFNGSSKGNITYRFGTGSKVEISYEITIHTKDEMKPRQYGLLMQAPISMQTLSWKRNGEFSVYPSYDIARTEGTAKLNANSLYEAEAWRKAPQADWKDDANICGSADFRATKTQIRSASLINNDGNGIYIYGNGKQSIRAWQQDGCIQLLIADYNNNGSEPFYGSPFTSGRISIKDGERISGKIVFELK